MASTIDEYIYGPLNEVIAGEVEGKRPARLLSRSIKWFDSFPPTIVDILRTDMAGKKGHETRLWPDDEKVSICAQTCAPGVSVSQVARRHAINTNLIHKWLRDATLATDLEIIEDGAMLSAC